MLTLLPVSRPLSLSRRHKDAEKTSRPERRRPRRHQQVSAMTLRNSTKPNASRYGANEDGASVDEFLEWFPGVGRGQVEAVLEYASTSLEEPVAA